MIFQSYLFLFAFFPVLFIVYYVLLKKKKIKLADIFLAAMSFVFYAYGNVKYLYFLSLEVLVNYAVYRLLVWLEYQKSYQKVRKWLCGGAVAGNLFLLFYYKYYNFFVENWNEIFHTEHSFRTLIVPLGISFITFQQIAFLVDVYRGECDRCTLLEYTIFVSFFPHISSGPIMTQDQFFPILRSEKRKEIDWDRINRGIFLFIFGLGKKVLLADMFGQAVDWGYGNIAGLNGMSMFLITVFYSFQIYFDFSGYSDMAIGISWMLNLDLPVNFDSPYKAYSVVEFWKRWHISLTRFLTKYIYIPLGGSRKGNLRTYCNTMIVFLCSGIWHGASWMFVLWGALHGVAMVLTKALKRYGEWIPRILKRSVTLLFINFTWIIFRTADLKELREVFRAFLKGGISINPDLFQFFGIAGNRIGEYAILYSILLLFSVIGILVFLLIAPNAKEAAEKMKYKVWHGFVAAGIIALCILHFSGVSSFVYFNF